MMTMSGYKDEMFFFKGVLLLTACGFILRIWGLASQPLSGDDVAVSVSAVNYMERGHLGPTMWNHPGLRNILVYLSLFFGRSIWGIKSISLVLGSASIPILALTAKQITKNGMLALLAAFFLAIDPLHIDFSRQAVHEVYMTFFTLLGIYLALRFESNRKPFLLFLSGVSFGLGISSKWFVVLSLVVTLFYLLYRVLKEPDTASVRVQTALYVVLALIAVPGVVYLLTFIPWFQRGFTLNEWVELQRGMYRETVSHQGYIPYTWELSHKAYLWFVKPASHADFIYGSNGPGVLLGIVNPLVWLLTIPSMLYLMVHAVRERAAEKYFLVGLFWFPYIPLLFTSRPIWAHTAFSVLPAAFTAIAYFLTTITRASHARKQLLVIYILLVIVVTIPLYLLAVGKGLDISWLRPVIEMYRPAHER